MKYPINRKARREAEILAKHMISVITHALGMKPLKESDLKEAASAVVENVEQDAAHGALVDGPPDEAYGL